MKGLNWPLMIFFIVYLKKVSLYTRLWICGLCVLPFVNCDLFVILDVNCELFKAIVVSMLTL